MRLISLTKNTLHCFWLSYCILTHFLCIRFGKRRSEPSDDDAEAKWKQSDDANDQAAAGDEDENEREGEVETKWSFKESGCKSTLG